MLNTLKEKDYPVRTNYANIKRFENGNSFKKSISTGRYILLDIYTSLKALNNKSLVSQRRQGRKFKINHSTICRQLAKIAISCYKLERGAS